MANGLTDTRPIRRGLARVAGGEPWPSASELPEGAPAVALAARLVRQGLSRVAGEPVVRTSQVPNVPAPVASARTPVAVAAPAARTSGVRAVGVRCGLPHTPGGEPRTPYDEVSGAVAELVAEAVEPVAVKPVVAERVVAVAVEPVPALRPAAPLATPSLLAPRPEPERLWRFTTRQWAGLALAGALLALALAAVLVARSLVSTDWMQDFLAAYPGESHLPESAPVGIPAWLGWQHFFNVFLMVLIIRSGLQVRNQKRPLLYWSPRGNPNRKISINLWFHQSLDILWLVNGVIYVVVLFVTGQWVRVIPTTWDVFPNALSALIQYVSLDWPTENGWVNYNSLQVLAYFTTIFIAAPLAAITGVRMSGIWPDKAKTLNRLYPVEWARALHFPIMLYFLAFIITHVALVLSTGALRNLNHMYASQDVVNWAGFLIFLVSIVVIVGAWIAARPIILASIARAFGRVSGR